MLVATAQKPAAVHVPRLVLPCSQQAPGDDLGNPQFRRQINVALGRAHSQRTPRRDVSFRVQQGVRQEKKQRAQLFASSSARSKPSGGGVEVDGMLSSSRSDWSTTTQSMASTFPLSPNICPRGTWYEEADKIFRFFGYIIDGVEPTARQAPSRIRLVIVRYYPQDATLEMSESKETATPGIGRTLALCRPSRVNLADIRVGTDVLINGTQVHVYDADDFTRRSIPGLLPRQLAPVPDNTFSITPRRGPPVLAYTGQGSQDPNASVGPSKAESAGVCPPSGVKNFASAAGAAFRDSLINQDPPGILRMYIRWDDTARADGTVHRYILHFFLEDGTVEMRELADAGGGHHFEGRFPVVIGRQKIFKGGKSRSLSVDRIGGDRATPRSARTTASGVRTAEDPRGGDVEEPLTPPDMVVGQTLVLMKRRMLVCGWDEAAHVWWENANGTSMRGRQVDMQEFQRCVRPSRSQPRPPNKTKSSFCEGPPNRPGTARGRFFKASENSGKTLRFLAKATSDTQTPSTSVNVFIIRFYPEDDTLSVYTSHNLGNNSGGLQKGVYLARRGDMINKDTGQPFKAGDFHIGFVASLPSVSLEVIDVDDFSRHHLVRGSPPACPEWQTSPMWQKLLNIAKRAWSSGGHDSTATAGSGPGTQKHAARVVSHSPGKKVTFFGNGNGNNGGAHPFTGDTAMGYFSYDDDDAGKGTTTTTTTPGVNKGGRGSLEVFSRLWAECVGDDTCGGFTNTRGDILEGGPSDSPDDGGGGSGGGGGDSLYGRGGHDGGGGDAAVANDMDTRISLGGAPRSPQKHPPSISSSPGCSPPSPWERLVLALLRRGVNVSLVLTAHEYTLLKRELADWHRGQESGNVGREQGTTADRLAAATAAANQPLENRAATITTARPGPSTAAPRDATSHSGKNKITADFAGNHGVGTAKNDSRQVSSDAASNGGKNKKKTGGDVAGNHGAETAAKNNASRNVSYGGFEYPWVVAAGGPSPSVVVGNHQENELESRQTIPAEMAASGVVGTGVNKAASLDTPLDLRKVALEAHDLPKTGRQDQILKQAMASVLMHIFGRGGEAAVRDTLKAEGKTPGDPADLWTMSRLLMVAAGLSCRHTEALWLKFMPFAMEEAGEGARVTFTGFLESVRAYEACLSRGEVLGFSKIECNPNNFVGLSAEE